MEDKRYGRWLGRAGSPARLYDLRVAGCGIRLELQFGPRYRRAKCMILFLYNVGLLLALVLGAPWWLWQMATTRKYREGLRERLGGVPERICDRQLTRRGPP
jgi:hypothetical protein